MTMTNKTRQIIVVVAVFVIALASLGTVIGLLVNTGQLSEYSDGFRYELNGSRATITSYDGSDTDVIVPDKLRGHKVVAIDSDAFQKVKDSVKSIKFNSKYSSFSIANGTFSKLTNLEKVVLPSNLKEIPYGAFEESDSLNTVIMPNSITKIGDNAFKGCDNLKFIYGSESYSSDVKDSAIYLPKSLIEIGTSAFEGCKGISDVNMFKSLDKIGDRAFYDCTNFITLVLENDIEVTTIGNYAFYNTRIRSTSSSMLNFPKLVSIGDYAFKSAKTNFNVFSLPSTVKKIGTEAFAESGLNEIRFAEDIQLEAEDMGVAIFQSCAELRTITVAGLSSDTTNTLPLGIKTIPERTFMGCYRLLLNRDFEVGKNVETIGDGAFAIYAAMGDLNVVTYSSNHVLKVNAENENFKIVELKENFRTNSNGQEERDPYRQGLLTDRSGEVVYAYYGTFDSQSYHKDIDKDKTNRGSLFRFWDYNTITLNFKEIKSYAFAGVQFSRILLPNTIDVIGDYVFYDSDVEVCYIAAIDWELTERSFQKSVKSDGIKNADVQVLIAEGVLNANAFLSKLGDYGVQAGRYKADNLQ